MNDLMLLNSNVELDLLSEMELLNVFGGNGEGCVTNNGCNIYCPSAGAPACSGGSPCGGSTCGGSPCGGSPCGGSPCGGSPCGGNPCGGNPCGGSPCGGSKTDTTISGNTVYVFANCKGH